MAGTAYDVLDSNPQQKSGTAYDVLDSAPKSSSAYDVFDTSPAADMSQTPQPPSVPGGIQARIQYGESALQAAGKQIPQAVSDLVPPPEQRPANDSWLGGGAGQAAKQAEYYTQHPDQKPGFWQTLGNAVTGALGDTMSWLNLPLRVAYTVGGGIKSYENALNQGESFPQALKAGFQGAEQGAAGQTQSGLGAALHATGENVPAVHAVTSAPFFNPIDLISHGQTTVGDVLGLAGDMALMEGFAPAKLAGMVNGTGETSAINRGLQGLLNHEKALPEPLQDIIGKARVAQDTNAGHIGDIMAELKDKMAAEGVKTPEQHLASLTEEFQKGHQAELQNINDVLNKRGALAAAKIEQQANPLTEALQGAGFPAPVQRPEISAQALHGLGQMFELDHQALHDIAVAGGYDTLKDPAARSFVAEQIKAGRVTPEDVKAFAAAQQPAAEIVNRFTAPDGSRMATVKTSLGGRDATFVLPEAQAESLFAQRAPQEAVPTPETPAPASNIRSYADLLQAVKAAPTSQEAQQIIAHALPNLEANLPDYHLRIHYQPLSSLPGPNAPPRSALEELQQTTNPYRGFMKEQKSMTVDDWRKALEQRGERTPILNRPQAIGKRMLTGNSANVDAQMYKEIAAHPGLSMTQDAAEKLGGPPPGWRPVDMNGPLKGMYVSPEVSQWLEYHATGGIGKPLHPVVEKMLNAIESVNNAGRSVMFRFPIKHFGNLGVNAFEAGLNPLTDMEHLYNGSSPAVQSALVRYGVRAPNNTFGEVYERGNPFPAESASGGPLAKALQAVKGAWNAWGGWSHDAIANAENTLKGALFSKLTSQGMPEAEAAARAGQAFGGRGLYDMPANRVARSLLLTPNWSVNNRLFQLRTLMEHPERLYALQKLQDAINAATVGYPASGNGPGHEEQMALPVANAKGVNYHFNPYLPTRVLGPDPLNLFANLANGRSGLPKEAGKLLTTELAPVPGFLEDLAAGYLLRSQPSDMTHGLDYSAGTRGPLFGYGYTGTGPNVPLPWQQASQRLIPMWIDTPLKAAGADPNAPTAGSPLASTLATLAGVRVSPFDPQRALIGMGLDAERQVQDAARLQGVKIPPPRRQSKTFSGGAAGFNSRAKTSFGK